MAAHRFWRLFLTACPQGTNVSAADIQFFDAAGGPNLATDPAAAIASSTDTRGAYTAAAGIVGQPSFWSAADQSGMPQWWGYDFGAGNPRSLIEVGFTARSDNGTAANYYTPTAFDVQCSDNGNAWTTAWHVDTTTWGSGETRAFNQPPPFAPGPYRYWRINVLSTNDTQRVNCGIIMLAEADGVNRATVPGSAYASSFYGGFPPSNSIVDAGGGFLIYPGNGTGWWAYDFGAGNARYVQRISIAAGSDHPGGAPIVYQVQCSNTNNGTDWLTAWSAAVQPSVNAGDMQQAQDPALTTFAPNQHRFWRIRVTKYSAPTDNQGNVILTFAKIAMCAADGVNRAVNPAASASNTNVYHPQYNPGAVASNAIVGQPGQFSSYAQGLPIFWRYDTGSGQSFNLQRLCLTAGDAANFENLPGAFDVQSSDTDIGDDWVTQWSVDNAAIATAAGQVVCWSDGALVQVARSYAFFMG